MAESFFNLLRCQSHYFKNFSLNFRIRYANSAGSKLKTVTNKVVLLSAKRFQIFSGHKFFHMLRFGSGKWIVRESKLSCFLVFYKQRKLRNPSKCQSVW